MKRTFIKAFIIGLVIGVISLFLTGCNHTNNRDQVMPVFKINEKQNFISLVAYMRDAKNVSQATKDEVVRRIESSGFGYICEHDRCFMYRGQVKVQIQPDHIYIEYPDKTYQRVWDTNQAADMLYNLS
jgi:hypothetical protein